MAYDTAEEICQGVHGTDKEVEAQVSGRLQEHWQDLSRQVTAATGSPEWRDEKRQASVNMENLVKDLEIKSGGAIYEQSNGTGKMQVKFKDGSPLVFHFNDSVAMEFSAQGASYSLGGVIPQLEETTQK